jgi:hypothetical protein
MARRCTIRKLTLSAGRTHQSFYRFTFARELRVQAAEFPKYRAGAIATLAVAYLALLAWQYTHGGVPAHSFMARDDMPAISNWWGALLVPLVAWIATGLMQRRLRRSEGDAALANRALRQMIVACGVAFAYAAAMGIIFLVDRDSPILSSLFFALPVIGFVLPIFRPEYVLGFALGMTYTFGPVLPLVISSVLASISAVAVLLLRPLVRRVIRFRKGRGDARTTPPQHS